MLSVKQGGIKYRFWVFDTTRPGIEPWSLGPLGILNSLDHNKNQIETARQTEGFQMILVGYREQSLKSTILRIHQRKIFLTEIVIL